MEELEELLEWTDEAIANVSRRPLDLYKYPLRNDDDLRRYREGMLHIRGLIQLAIEKELK